MAAGPPQSLGGTLARGPIAGAGRGGKGQQERIDWAVVFHGLWVNAPQAVAPWVHSFQMLSWACFSSSLRVQSNDLTHEADPQRSRGQAGPQQKESEWFHQSLSPESNVDIPGLGLKAFGVVTPVRSLNLSERAHFAWGGGGGAGAGGGALGSPGPSARCPKHNIGTTWWPQAASSPNGSFDHPRGWSKLAQSLGPCGPRACSESWLLWTPLHLGPWEALWLFSAPEQGGP